MNFFNKKSGLILIGLLFGVMSAVLAATGNPANMAFCIACFIRDIAGSMHLHQAAVVQYLRPEIIGLILGSFLAALAGKEFHSTGGSSPAIRFVLGFIMMIGSLVFLGCPLRMVIRLAGGDANALVGLAGFIAGIACGIFLLRRGFSLGRAQKTSTASALVLPVSTVFVFIIGLFGVFVTSTEGPGSMHAPIFLALLMGLLFGAFAQKSRLCMAGGFRDLFLIKDGSLAIQFFGIFVVMLIYNLLTGHFKFGFADQPVAHTMQLWNFLGLYAVGLAAVMAGGCPLRQLILAGQGNNDSVITFLGLLVGAAFAHNFGWAASPKGVPVAGQIACVAAIVVLWVIGLSLARKKAA